jgi:hypothetical protein
MIDLAFIVGIWFFVSVILKRDKKDRKRIKEIGEQLRKEEKRRIKEEKLHSVRVPGVVYLSDYRYIPPQPKVIA